MTTSLRPLIVAGLIASIASISPIVSAQPAATPAPAAPPVAAATSAAQPDYHPSIADLMNIGIQPRHTKIGMALSQQNWAYLAYEANELKGDLTRVARTAPLIDRKFDTAAMIQSTVAPPLQDLADALKAKDLPKSTAAYAALTASCNACHQAVSHGVIVIKLPQAEAYPDQDFRPQTAP